MKTNETANKSFSIVATKVPAALAEEYSAFAKQNHTTVSRLLSNHMRNDLHEPVDAQHCTLTIKNVNRLFKLAGQYSVGKNPEELVNTILDQYFETLKKTVEL